MKITRYREEYADSVIKDNEKRNSTSVIDFSYREHISSIIDNNYASKEKVDGLIMNSDNNNFVYVNPNTNMISQVKLSEKDNIIGSEFEVFDNIKKKYLSINTSKKKILI
ncbi:hypothetical protein [Paraclostridium sordellii]|uniref:hypothetical protein n=1 Tax=Paraclostridium sordellii TaxID=1505 RepID=UPI0005E7B249|nr:hypothetical protein [Paeniclostridium sordellii]CEN86983.1 Uncharacterised protein [[Clostridium] sordellii] [Paeniclostridium sordellii]